MRRWRLFWIGFFVVLSWGFAERATTAVDPSEPWPSHHSAPQPHGEARHPNIVFILIDDMTLHDFQFMPKVKKLLIEEGTNFSNYFVINSQCCPLRSSILCG